MSNEKAHSSIATANNPQNNTPAMTATPEYKIGDTGPAGGLIFYDKKNNRDGRRYQFHFVR